MKKPELLAPAGSIQSMKAAISAGADAIYIGGEKFGARAYADNPDESNLLDALDYCHFHNRKLYLTVNTLFKEKELKNELRSFLRPLYEAGLDAVIVQDYGAVSFIREMFPTLPIHASTQMHVSGYQGARVLGDMGIERVVLPRELNLDDVKRVVSRSGIETEVFVHGALCYCSSGMCLMSSLIGGRSGNRGRCAQICRLPFPKDHLLNLKDLNTLHILPDIIDTGVTSLKIEGRMKSPRYTAGVTSIYRKYIDMYAELGRDAYKVSNNDIHILNELFNRGGTTTGYFERHNGKDMIYKGEKPEKRIVDERVLAKIDELYLKHEFKEKASAKVTIIAGRPAKMELESGGIKVVVTGDTAAPAEKKPLSEEDVIAKISKFGDSKFELEGLEVNLRGRVFMPVSALNALRREAIEKLEKERINGYKRAHI